MRNIIIFLSLLLSGELCSQSTLTGVRRERLDSLFRELKTDNLFNGGVLISEKGKVVYQQFGGYANMATKALNTDTTLFNTASVSKIFTSIGILQLAEKKLVDLQAQVSSYLKDFPFHTITVRDLLNHFSGLPRAEEYETAYIKLHPKEVISDAKLYAHLIAMKDSISVTPGKFVYNNMNYVLLAMIVERVAGDFRQYMRKNIFEPAGMKTTYVRRPDQPNTLRYVMPGAWETRYLSVDSLDPIRYNTGHHLNGMFGPSNVISNLRDLHAFDIALSKGKLLSLTLLHKAWKVPVLKDGSLFLGPSKHTYGLGWNILYPDKYGDTVVYHDGNIPGVNSIFYKNLTKDQTIIWYTNAESPGFFQKIYSIAYILNDKPALQILKTGKKKSVVNAYAKLLVNEGIDKAAIALNELMADTANYYMNELQMNSLGYDLYFKPDFPGHNELALEVMKINTLLYKSANSFDSYGDVLMWTGKKQEAILAYKRSLQLNPNNSNAKKNLAVLEK
jgi:CubicO group peptidase (beta-lactamase class C family)